MGCVLSVTPRPRLSQGKGPQDPLYRKHFSSSGKRTPVVQSVVRHYTDWAIPAPQEMSHHHHHHRLYNSVRVLASLKSRLWARLLLGFVTMIIFTVWGQPQAQPPTWRTRVPLLVWVMTFDLSGKGDPASSYPTAGIALRITWPLDIPTVGTGNEYTA
jgi:hypothetical protein